MPEVHPEIAEQLFSKYIEQENYVMALCLFCYCRDFSMPVFNITSIDNGNFACLYTVMQEEGQPVHAAVQAESLHSAREAAALKLLTKLSKDKETTKEVLQPSTNYSALLGQLCVSYRIGERRVLKNKRFAVPVYADAGGKVIAAFGIGNTIKEAQATAVRCLYHKIVRIRRISAGNH